MKISCIYRTDEGWGHYAVRGFHFNIYPLALTFGIWRIDIWVCR